MSTIYLYYYYTTYYLFFQEILYKILLKIFNYLILNFYYEKYIYLIFDLLKNNAGTIPPLSLFILFQST